MLTCYSHVNQKNVTLLVPSLILFRHQTKLDFFFALYPACEPIQNRLVDFNTSFDFRLDGLSTIIVAFPTRELYMYLQLYSSVFSKVVRAFGKK